MICRGVILFYSMMWQIFSISFDKILNQLSVSMESVITQCMMPLFRFTAATTTAVVFLSSIACASSE